VSYFLPNGDISLASDNYTIEMMADDMRGPGKALPKDFGIRVPSSCIETVDLELLHMEANQVRFDRRIHIIRR